MNGSRSSGPKKEARLHGPKSNRKAKAPAKAEATDWKDKANKALLEVSGEITRRLPHDQTAFCRRLCKALDDFQTSFERESAEAIYYANTFASPTPVASGGENKQLTPMSTMPITHSVKTQLPKLIERLKAATRERGKASALAKYLDVPKESVSRWIAGRVEPGG